MNLPDTFSIQPPTLRQVLRPEALLTVLANALPVVGALAWGWDIYLILLVYWFETAMIGFWMILRIALMDRDALAVLNDGRQHSPVGLALFLMLHAGIFMGVHFMFLWALFSGAWPQRVHGVADFFRLLVIGSGLWIALLALFVAHGARFLGQVMGRDPWRALVRALWGSAPADAGPAPDDGTMWIVAGFYVRIFMMQFAIILGGMLSLALGSFAPLLILIGLKTFAELTLGALPARV